MWRAEDAWRAELAATTVGDLITELIATVPAAQLAPGRRVDPAGRDHEEEPSMKIFLAGGTGVVGTRALPALVAAGHDVTAVARTDAKADLVRSLGGEPVTVDLFDPLAVGAAVVGHEVVVNLATSIPPTDQGGPRLGLDHQRAAAQRGVEPPRRRRARGGRGAVRPGVDRVPLRRQRRRVDRRGPPGRPGRPVQRRPRRRGGGRPLRRATAVQGWCCASRSSTPRTAATRRPSTRASGVG